jgi:hypothetical protein
MNRQNIHKRQNPTHHANRQNRHKTQRSTYNANKVLILMKVHLTNLVGSIKRIRI